MTQSPAVLHWLYLNDGVALSRLQPTSKHLSSYGFLLLEWRLQIKQKSPVKASNVLHIESFCKCNNWSREPVWVPNESFMLSAAKDEKPNWVHFIYSGGSFKRNSETCFLMNPSICVFSTFRHISFIYHPSVQGIFSSIQSCIHQSMHSSIHLELFLFAYTEREHTS